MLVLMVFTVATLHAQKQVEKEVDYRGESVKIKIDLASDIEVKTWNKSSIRVEASISSEESKVNEEFDLITTRSGSALEIASNEMELFKMMENEDPHINRDNDFEAAYIIYVPEGVDLNLSSITGSLNSDYLNGKISIDLITGDINLKKAEGDLTLKTITGKIELPVKNTSFEAKTVMGEIYANADLEVEKQEHFIGREMTLNIQSSKNHLSLNTITGNIYLQ